MWSSVVIVVLSTPIVGSFDVSFSRPVSTTARLSSALTSRHRSSLNYRQNGCFHRSNVRCRRRRSGSTTATVMMAGPNKGKAPSFFSDWPVLEAELKSYLAERDADVAPVIDAEPGKRNAVLEYLSVDPVKMALENEPDGEEWEGETNILAYTELTRYGYGYLIEPMMKIGGYTAASERLGIPLNERTLKDRQYYESRGLSLSIKKPETDGFLTLGRARDERLDAVAQVDREQKSKALFSKQAMMDKESREKAVEEVAKPRMLNRSRSTQPSAVIGSAGDTGETPFRKPGLPEDLKGPTAWKPAKDTNAVPPQPLLLSLPQRLYTIIVVACCALAYGRGTVDVLEKGYLSPEIADVAGIASLFLVGLNVASAVVGGSIAKGKGRSVPLWVFKGSLAGLTSVLELKGLPSIVLPSGSGDEDMSRAT